MADEILGALLSVAVACCQACLGCLQLFPLCVACCPGCLDCCRFLDCCSAAPISSTEASETQSSNKAPKFENIVAQRQYEEEIFHKDKHKIIVDEMREEEEAAISKK